MTNQEAIEDIMNNIKPIVGGKSLDMAIEALEERKTGHWIPKDLKWECDQCGCRIRRAKPFSGNAWNYYYCPNCGCKMEVKND